MPNFSLRGNVNFGANTNLTPGKDLWSSNGSSNLLDNLNDYSQMNTNGSISIPSSALYTLVFTCNAKELNYSGTGIISILYTPINGSNSFILASKDINTTIEHTMPFMTGDVLSPIFSFGTAYSVSLSSPTTFTGFQYSQANASKAYYYYASTSIPPIVNQQPRILDFSGTVTTGFQVTIPITVDGTVNGLACFQYITSILAIAQSPVKTNSVNSMLLCSLDPTVNMKLVVVNVSTGNTVVVGGAALQTPPNGAIVYLTVKGW